MNKEMLLSWVRNGFAIEALEDGAWAWTIEGKKLPLHVRHVLSNLLYGKCPDWEIKLWRKELFSLGFGDDGFFLEDEEK